MDFFADDNAYFHADKHVSVEKEDEFGRYPFAAKLAKLIASHQSSYGLVIGVYGQWGEGKSSFLDFVQTATDLLSKQEPERFKTITIKFNPWRFSTEDQLLMSFFAELRVALDAATEVDKDTDEIKEKLWKYAQIVVARQSASITVESTNAELDRFKELGSLETLKADINHLIEKTGRKILVFIDDSDRLNNEEVESTLRLVKLTADFTNTTYLIGLNHKMVAAAVGQRYPGGNSEAGSQFLEKIVQVPLYLPPIQLPQLRRYLEARLAEVLTRTGDPKRLPSQDLTRYYNALEESVISLHPNPRSIYRLANVLLVAIPLLEEDANLIDIILIEALRIFHPTVYELVKDNESVFTGSSYPLGDSEREAINKILGQEGIHAGRALNLLADIFPKIDTIYFDRGSTLHPRRRRTQTEINYTRSIASDYYFKRYFYYAIQEGTIPEQTFNTFLQAMAIGHVDEACKQAIEMIELSGDEEFFRRLEDRLKLDEPEYDNQLPIWESLLSPEQAELYCNLLIALSSSFSKNILEDRALRVVSRSSQVLLGYFTKLSSSVILNVCQRVINNSSNINFPFEFIVDIFELRRQQSFLSPNHVKALFLNESTYQKLTISFIERLKKYAYSQNKPWYEIFPLKTAYLAIIWFTAYGKESLTESLKPLFAEDLENFADFLYYMSPIGRSDKEFMYLSLNKKKYDFIEQYFETNYLYRVAKDLVADEEPITYIKDDFTEPDPHERVHQFILLHDKHLKDKRIQEEEKVMHQIRFEAEDDADNETIDFD